MKGDRLLLHSLSNQVGIGSNHDCLFGILRISFSTSASETHCKSDMLLGRNANSSSSMSLRPDDFSLHFSSKVEEMRSATQHEPPPVAFNAAIHSDLDSLTDIVLDEGRLDVLDFMVRLYCRSNFLAARLTERHWSSYQGSDCRTRYVVVVRGIMLSMIALETMASEAASLGLELNWQKTKVQALSSREDVIGAVYAKSVFGVTLVYLFIVMKPWRQYPVAFVYVF